MFNQQFSVVCCGLIFTMMLAACQPIQPVSGPPNVPAEVPAVTNDDLSQSPAAVQARADLATHLGLAESAIRVIGVQNVAWPDAALGCPEEGMMYAAVLTEGMLISLRADGQLYEYHSGGTDAPFLCENPAPGQPLQLDAAAPIVPVTEPVTDTVAPTDTVISQEPAMSLTIPVDNPFVLQAVDDLVTRLAVTKDAIIVASAESVTWPDKGFGCPRPGLAYVQVPQDGLKIVLVVDGKPYNYHSGAGRPPFLCENAG